MIRSAVDRREHRNQGLPARTLGTFAAVLCSVFVGTRPATAAVADYLGRPVASVHLAVEGHETTESMLTQVVETAPGQPLSMSQVRDEHHPSVQPRPLRGRARRRDPRRRWCRIALRPDPDSSGRPHAICPRRRDARCRRRRHAAGDRRSVRDVAAARRGWRSMPRLIADTLREQGYLHATVSPRSELAHAARARDAGLLDRSGAADDDRRAPGRRSAGRVRARSLLAPWAEARGAVPAPGAERANRAYDRGAPEGRLLRSENHTDGRARRMTIASPTSTLTVTPGPLVRVVFTGDPLPSDARPELVPVEREGSVDEDLLEDSTNRIEEYLRAQGYREAAAPHTREREKRRADHHLHREAWTAYRVSRRSKSPGTRRCRLTEFEATLRTARRPAVFRREARGRCRHDSGRVPAARLCRRAGATRRSRSRRRRRRRPSCRWPCGCRSSEGVRTMVSGVRVAGNQAIGDPVLRAKVVAARRAVHSRASRRQTATRWSRLSDLGYQSGRRRAANRIFRGRARVSSRVYRSGRSAGVRRPRPDRRQRADQHRYHRARAADEARRSVQYVRDNESQRRLTSLGLFRRVQITELRHAAETRAICS